VFEKASFDVNTFVQQHTSRVALETLQADLSRYLDGLNANLVSLINTQYADFVNLSTQLKGVDTTVDAIKVPVQAIRAFITDVRDMAS